MSRRRTDEELEAPVRRRTGRQAAIMLVTIILVVTVGMSLSLSRESAKRVAAERRIEVNKAKIARQDATIESLKDGQEKLAEQVRELGGIPVVTPAPSVPSRPTNRPGKTSRTPTSRPTSRPPAPTASPPHSTPQPQPQPPPPTQTPVCPAPPVCLP